MSKIKNGVVEIPYDNDDWGGSGTIVITFLEEDINCEIKDLQSVQDQMWGFSEGEYALIRNDSLLKAMGYDPDDSERTFLDLEGDGIPYVPTLSIDILGTTFSPSNFVQITGEGHTGFMCNVPVSGTDRVAYYAEIADPAIFCGVRDGIIVAYFYMYNVSGLTVTVGDLFGDAFDDTPPKTVIRAGMTYFVWRASNGYIVLFVPSNFYQDYLNDYVGTVAYFTDINMCFDLTED
jgi:hypothetical protein